MCKISHMRKITQKYYIADTDVEKGVFAKRQIRKDEIILKFTGPIINSKQINDRHGKYRGGRPLQIEDNKYIGIEKPGVFINHSCNPNAGIKKNVNLIALKNIKKDDEIRFDYSTTMDEDSWTMKCKCHKKNCRKIIKDFKYLPKNTQGKYLKLGIVQRFIAKKYGK